MKYITKSRLGDVRNSSDFGHKSQHKYIYHACEDCGDERWVRVRRGNIPTSLYCRKCMGKRRPNAQIKEKFRRGANREERISEAWGEYCYLCEKKTKVLHRKNGKPHGNLRRMSVTDFNDVYCNQQDEFVKVCTSHHPRVHGLEKEGYSWQYIEEFIKSFREG